MRNLFQSHLTLAALFSSTLLIGGCGSTGAERAEATADSLKSSVASIEQGKGLVDKALAALDKVQQTANSDPRPAYKEYTQSVDAIEEAAAKVSSKVSDMSKRGKEYYSQWEKELSGMNSEQLKAISSERRAQSLAAFNSVSDGYRDVARDYKPFISDLRDIRTYLDNDLTPAGINTIKPVADKAKADGSALKASLSNVQNQFGTLSAAVAPYAK